VAIEADVAQLVEQSIRNRQVTGSSPVVGSIPNAPLRIIENFIGMPTPDHYG
jgi:hypothetical protein